MDKKGKEGEEGDRRRREREKGEEGEREGKRTIETLLIRHIINQQNAHGTTVISGSNGTETLLTSSIPNLQLDTLVIELDGANLKVNADGGDEGGGEAVFAESKQTA
jgi:hypothetical protein